MISAFILAAIGMGVKSNNKSLQQLGYTQTQISNAEHIYLLSERGYARLIKIMSTDQKFGAYFV